MLDTAKYEVPEFNPVKINSILNTNRVFDKMN
jgi:hypothetical protein